MAVEIKQITTRRELKKFIQFGNEFYKDCEYFCPQLISDELNVFDAKINPAHEVCEHILFMAYRDNRPVRSEERRVGKECISRQSSSRTNSRHH